MCTIVLMILFMFDCNYLMMGVLVSLTFGYTRCVQNYIYLGIENGKVKLLFSWLNSAHLVTIATAKDALINVYNYIAVIHQ